MATPSPPSSTLHDNKLTSDIFSILETNFLFNKHHHHSSAGKVRILTIDAAYPVLAATTLLHLQSILRRKSGNPTAHISDFFDAAAGSGSGAILAALLFTRGKHGSSPISTAEDSLKFILDNRRKLFANRLNLGIFNRKSKAAKVLNKVFDELTLRDTIKPVLIPCFDLTTAAPFLFSRADALEMDGCDFPISGVLGATVAADRAVEVKSTDGKRKVVAVGGGVAAMSNPTAAAITHVLNNKQEFPLCGGVEDLLVVSLGGGGGGVKSTPADFIKIAGDGAADMVDQAVSMAFGESRTSNYVRIQGNGLLGKGEKSRNTSNEILMGEKNVESVLFRGKKITEFTNMEKLEMFAGELIKEQERRKTSILPNVALKHHSTTTTNNSPTRSSSATTLSTLSS